MLIDWLICVNFINQNNLQAEVCTGVSIDGLLSMTAA